MGNDDLTTLEEELFRSYHSDGAVELLLGTGLLFVAWFSWEGSSSVFTTLVPVYLLLAVRAWKKRITHPRLGYARWNSERRHRIEKGKRVLLWTLLGCTLLMVGMVLLEKGGILSTNLLDHSVQFVAMPLIALAMVVMAATRGQSHFYLFAGVCLVLMFLVTPLNLHLWGTMLILGAPLFILGIIRTFRFISQHPKVSDIGSEM